MTYEEIVTNAKQDIGKYCKACMVCNGRACRNQMPGPGAKGMGDTAIRNFDKWQEIRVQMDTISEHEEVDTSFVLWGQRFRYPFFAGPVGAVNLHYGEKYNDQSYNDVMVAACAEAGIAAMTGDGVNPDVMKYATDAIRRVEGKGIPTIKPWNIEIIREKMKQAEGSGAFAVAMDIDAAGLPFLKKYDTAGRQKICRRITPGGRDGKSSIYRKRNYDRKGRHQSGGGRCRCDCCIQSWRACARPVPGHCGGTSCYRGGSAGKSENICRWWDPFWCRCL